MPTAPLRPCAMPGCPEFVQAGERHCKTHRSQTYAHRRERTGTTAQQGYGGRHRNWRKMVLARHPVCCEPGCGQAATEADHIVSLKAGGSWSLDNGQGLCKRHHSIKTVREDGGFGNARKLAQEGRGGSFPLGFSRRDRMPAKTHSRTSSAKRGRQ